MLPPAPGLASTMTATPSDSASAPATNRDSESALPPAPKPWVRVMGRCGHCCALALAKANRNMAIARTLRIMAPVPVQFLLDRLPNAVAGLSAEQKATIASDRVFPIAPSNGSGLQPARPGAAGNRLASSPDRGRF